ncbi:MAG: bifunctional folylpolyglutamate synthase/dihydrofolate synthase [Candidatus Methanoplasma sp.]|jgi:dihydrofolate synthase/folylpolyglutamate synthase|nr:bifunctional folylpolyglutamate synthase/dihydrofolate synthase [Candidatus Methanoplasma sp.]
MRSDLRSWLYSFAVHGIKLDLENTKDLLRRIGDPQKEMKYIHVGGTDGKGSISSCIASILISSGVRTGLYTSPHIMDINERMTVNGENITDDEAEDTLAQIKESVEEMEAEGKTPTFFEVVTAMAFLYFRNKGVEYAVMEVGMGGRLDSTNVIVPEVSVIGNISLEHQEYLGSTIEEIAFEKAGIIKPGVPCVTMNGDPVFSVLKKAAAERGAPIIRIDPEDINIEKMSADRVEFLYKEERYTVSIPGSRQADNASMAVEAVSKLRIYGQCIRCNIKKGLKDVRWPCRMEKVGALPIILDVTHTAAGSKALADDVSALYGKVDIVIGILRDKDAATVADNLSRISGRVYVSRLDTERSADPYVLKEIFGARIPETTACKSISEAMDLATSSKNNDRNILVTGSFHTAEEAIAWIRRTYPGYWTYSQRSTTEEHIPEGRRKA